MKVSLQPLYEATSKEIVVDKHHFVIGRAEDCDLVLDSLLISRRHCVVTVDDETVSVRDLESTNGTAVNGRRIFGRRLVFEGDLLHLDALGYRIHIRATRPLALHLLRLLPGRFVQTRTCVS